MNHFTVLLEHDISSKIRTADKERISKSQREASEAVLFLLDLADKQGDPGENGIKVGLSKASNYAARRTRNPFPRVNWKAI